MIKINTLAFFMSISSFLIAQNMEWVKDFGGGFSDFCTDISIASTGDIYTIGYFMDDIAFSNNTPLMSSTEAWGTFSTFIKKDNADGELVWGKIIHSDSANYERVVAQNMTMDLEDNLYISGYYSGEVDFDPGTEIHLQNAGADNNELFILKLDRDGHFVWVKTISGSGSKSISGLSFDTQGFINIVGTYNEEIDMGAGSQLSYVNTEDKAIFIAKFDLSGELFFSKELSNEGTECIAHAVTTDSFGSIYISGSFNGSLDFDPSETENMVVMPTGTDRDLYLLKLTDEGDFSWLKTYYGNETAYFSSQLEKDAANNIYICGAYRGETNFGTIDHPAIHTSVDRKDVYIQKMNSDGVVLWTTTFGDEYDDQANDLGIDENGNVYLTGHYTSYSDFGGSYSDAFIMKLDENGQILWHNLMPPSHFASGKGLFVKNANHIVASGYFESTLEVGTENGVVNITSHESVDCFIIKVAPQIINSTIDTIESTAINIFPNPTSNEITIENSKLNKDVLSIEIYTTKGELAYFSKINTSLHYKTIDVSNFPAGTYNLIIHCQSGDVFKVFVKY